MPDRRDVSDAVRWFWVAFWSTLLILLLLYLYVQAKVQLVYEVPPSPEASPPALSQTYLEKLQQVVPEVFREVRGDLDVAVAEIDALVSERVDAAFAPVYRAIPDFLDFHYSLLGEYAELAAAASDDIGRDLQRILFEDTDFETGFQHRLVEITHGADAIESEFFRLLRRRLHERMADHPAPQPEKLTELADIVMQDTRQRFGTGDLVLKGTGALVGGGAVATALAKTVGAKAATKLAAKAAGKTAIKATGVGGSATAGAAAGLLCGPAAWICAPVGGAAAAVAAWFATDKVVLEVDEYFNRDAFEAEVRGAIDTERLRVRDTLRSSYHARLHAMVSFNESRLRDMTTRELIEQSP